MHTINRRFATTKSAFRVNETAGVASGAAATMHGLNLEQAAPHHLALSARSSHSKIPKQAPLRVTQMDWHMQTYISSPLTLS